MEIRLYLIRDHIVGTSSTTDGRRFENGKGVENEIESLQ